MTIADIRSRICELVTEGDEIRAAIKEHLERWEANDLELLRLAEATKRQPPAKPRAPVRSRRMTAEIAKNIRIDMRANPRLSEQELANKYGVNPGRVSEALNGRW